MDLVKKYFNKQNNNVYNTKDNETDEKTYGFKQTLYLILNDLLKPIKNKDFEFNNYTNFTDLTDPVKCNKLKLFLSKNLDKKFSKKELEVLNDDLLIEKKPFEECKTDA